VTYTYATVISGWCKIGRIEDAAKVFDEMLARAVLKNARVLLLDEASRVQDAVGRMLRRCAGQRCAGAARQGWGGVGTADEEEEE
jgi:pentatricopeptide repeat protein